MTPRQLAQWIATLPDAVQDGEVNSIVHGGPSSAKRVVAYRWKESGNAGIYVESMGTHMHEEHGAGMDYKGVLSA